MSASGFLQFAMQITVLNRLLNLHLTYHILLTSIDFSKPYKNFRGIQFLTFAENSLKAWHQSPARELTGIYPANHGIDDDNKSHFLELLAICGSNWAIVPRVLNSFKVYIWSGFSMPLMHQASFPTSATL